VLERCAVLLRMAGHSLFQIKEHDSCWRDASISVEITIGRLELGCVCEQNEKAVLWVSNRPHEMCSSCCCENGFHGFDGGLSGSLGGVVGFQARWTVRPQAV
jgi:hypothetical protein